MGMRPSDNDIEREIREAEAQAEAAARKLAEQAVTRWNKLMERSATRHRPDWSPRIGVALAAKFYFLDVVCPGCRQLNGESRKLRGSAIIGRCKRHPEIR